MKRDSKYTESEIDQWLNIFDQNIITDIGIQLESEEMTFDNLVFETFLELYQQKHLKKYGNYLELKL